MGDYRQVVEETIDYGEEPSKENWALKPLYKTTEEGKESQWQVGFCAGEGRLWIMHGLTISIPQVKTREVKTNNSGRSLREQALLEARNRYMKMGRKGYYATRGKVHVREPMLANEYKEERVKNFPVAIQAKLDGVRALLYLGPDGEVRIVSRTGREWPHLEKIREEAKRLFSHLPPGCVLDGEIYSFRLSFDELSGLMRTTKSSRKDEDKADYFVFDVIDPENSYFEGRYALLEKAFSSFSSARVYLLPTYTASSHLDILRAHDIWVGGGCEGCMVRRISWAETNKELSLYKPRRCNNLLKCKAPQDEEVEIVGVGEGSGTEEGLAVFRVRDGIGNEFEVRPQGSFSTRKEWFDHPSLVLGRRYTIRFFGKTPKGIPRFPVGVALRDYE